MLELFAWVVFLLVIVPALLLGMGKAIAVYVIRHPAGPQAGRTEFKRSTIQQDPLADETTFKLDQALSAQQALRSSLGLQEEIFPVEAFVGMISDEIEASRKAGKADQTIADLVKQVTGKTVTIENIRQFYTPPEQRQGHGG